MRNYLYIALVIFIFFVGFFVRFYRLDGLPGGLNQDETAIGYNAYTILQTGKDEYGFHLPLYFKSFGDYKLPVYIYLTVASIKIFGVTAFAVRFWSAFAGVGSVIIVFFLLKILTKRKDIPLIASALFAINPWSVFFSRVAFEVNVANFFLALGVLLFVLFTKKKSAFLLLFSLVNFGISLYTYNVTRLVAPSVFLGLVFWYRQDMQKIALWKKSFFTLLFAAMVVPFALTLFSGSGLSSQKGVLIFGGESLARMLELRGYMPSLISKLLFNNWFQIVFAYIQNLVGFFNVRFFFISAESFAVSIGNVGVFYLFEALTIPFGFFAILKKYLSLRVFIFWFFIVLGIIALSTNAPHPTRDFTLLIPCIVFSAIGLMEIYYWIRKQKKEIKIATQTVGGILIGYIILYAGFSYLFRFPVLSAKTYRTADRDLAVYLKQLQGQYEHIIIDSDADFIYTSLLFYQGYNPSNFLADSEHENDSSFIHMTRIGKYTFRKIDWIKDSKLPHTLLITASGKNALGDPIQRFAYPERHVVLYVNGVFPQYPVVDIAYQVYDTQTYKK